MKRYQKLLLLLPLLFILNSCSYIYGEKGVIQNRDSDYLKARSTPPLKLPPETSQSTIQTHYPTFDRKDEEEAKKITLIPPELNNSTIETKAATPTPKQKSGPPKDIQTMVEQWFSETTSTTDPKTKANTASNEPPPKDIISALRNWMN